MNKLIFVGGAPGSGKSTFVNMLQECLENAEKYRRVQGFYDLAIEKNIDKNEIFKKISSEEVDLYFYNKVLDNDIVISDIHYAVQMERNVITGANGNMYSEYVCTLSDNLIKKLIDARVELYAVHISCSPDECYKRAIARFQKNERELRNISIEDAILENNAEKNMWNNICFKYDCIRRIELRSDMNTPEELCEQMKNIIISEKAKKLALKKIL